MLSATSYGEICVIAAFLELFEVTFVKCWQVLHLAACPEW